MGDYETVAEARIRAMDAVQCGPAIDCPVCDRKIKAWVRDVDYRLVAVLRALYDAESEGLTGLEPDPLIKMTSGGDYAKPRFWGLMKKKGNYWVITDKGVDFLEGNLQIWDHIYTFNKKIIAHSDKLVGVDECKKKKIRKPK